MATFKESLVEPLKKKTKKHSNHALKMKRKNTSGIYLRNVNNITFSLKDNAIKTRI